jgi:hypothetical protein
VADFSEKDVVFMKSISTLPLFLSLLVLLVSLACGFSLPNTAPTATLPPAVDSPLKLILVGQWKVESGGTWEGSVLTFSDDGKFSIVGGLQEKDAEGIYFFTSEITVAFRLPNYQGTITLEFLKEFDNFNFSSMTVVTSLEPFGTIYSVQRVK